MVRQYSAPVSGQLLSLTNSYVQLEGGLNYQDANGNWLPSSDQIELQPGQAVAQHGQYQVTWAANINTYGAISVTGPDGTTSRSHVLGIAYVDPASGTNAVIATIKDSIGAVNGNQVFYQDAFQGVLADIRYTYGKAAFGQDIVLREQLPDPAALGFNPSTVEVQVMTEFVGLPAATVQALSQAQASTSTNRIALGASAKLYTSDSDVRIGEMEMDLGKAFMLPVNSDQQNTPVRKSLELFDGTRTILLETVDFQTIESDLTTLPPPAKPTASILPPRSFAPGPNRQAPPAPERQVVDATSTKQLILLATASDAFTSRRGYVLDYDLNVGTTNNLTLQGDTTYYVTGQLTATNITTIEGGTVVKFAATNNAELKIKGTIKCMTGPYRPAIFTAKDDDSLGTSISGSTGSPSGYYALHALNIDDNTSDLRYLHIRYAKQGIYYGSASAFPHFLRHIQITQTGEGVVSLSPVFYVQNALLYNVVTNFTTTASGITGNVEQLTTDIASRVNGSSSLTLYVTNSLLVQVTNSSSYSGSGNATASSGSGIFQTIGAGAHYLPASSPYRNAGVTNISFRLLADFQNMTTTGPTVFSNTVISVNTTLSPVAARDSDVPDLGYHYVPLDYVMGGVFVTNATLVFTNGVAVGTFASANYIGLNPTTGSQVISVGAPVRPNVVSIYNTVQEEANHGWTTPSGYAYSIFELVSGLNLTFRFTQFYASASSSFGHLAASSISGTCNLNDCEFTGGFLNLNPYTPTYNCLFRRVSTGVGNYYNSTAAINIYNCTFAGGSVGLVGWGSYGTWTIKDCLFYQPTVSQLYANPVSGNNAYISGYSRLTPTNSTDKIISAFTFDKGPLGEFYVPDTATLTNAGSRAASSAGLYHYTEQLNQTKETNSTVDIGYHYVAVVPASAEIDKATMVPTGSSTCCSWPASNTTNIVTTDPGWVNGSYTNINEYLQVDLGSSKTVLIAGYTPRQYTTMVTDGTGNNNGAYRDFSIYVTDNNSGTPSNWGSPLFTGRFNWPNGQERRDLEFNPAKGRYVYFYRINAYGWYGPTDSGNAWHGWPGYAGANEIWIYQSNGFSATAVDTDGDGIPDYFEDSNGDGTVNGSETSWTSYNSPNGLSGSPALQVYTEFKN